MMPADPADPADRAILLTPAGAAAIAVVRIRGRGIEGFLRSHFRRDRRDLTPLRCLHGELRDEDGNVIDDPVVVVHADRATADINLHGGPWVVASMMQLLRRCGFDVDVDVDVAAAEQGLDLLDGRTMLDREVHGALPRARTEEAVRMLLAQPPAWREFLSRGPSDGEVRSVLDDRCLTHLLNPPRVAIVGPPNVGKSTLANQLFGQQRSITADLPGTTRDWVGETANIDGLPVVLVDTPGLRATADDIEAAAIERARNVIGGADLVVSVSDPSTRDDAPATYANHIHVLNKADLLTEGESPEPAVCLTVATTGQGVDALRGRIRAFFGCADLSPNRPRCWTARQRDALQRDPRDVLVGHE